MLVNLHTAVIGRRVHAPLSALAGGARAKTVAEAETGRRRVWFDSGWRETPVYDRARLPIGAALNGPAIATQMDCTIVIEPGDRAETDALGNLIVEVGP